MCNPADRRAVKTRGRTQAMENLSSRSAVAEAEVIKQTLIYRELPWLSGVFSLSGGETLSYVR